MHLAFFHFRCKCCLRGTGIVMDRRLSMTCACIYPPTVWFQNSQYTTTICLLSSFAILPPSYVLNLSLVFDILDIVCSGMWKTSLQWHYVRNAGHMKQVFRHTVFVLQLFVMAMKQMYKYVSVYEFVGGVWGWGWRKIRPYIKTVLPVGGQEGGQNLKNCVS